MKHYLSKQCERFGYKFVICIDLCVVNVRIARGPNFPFFAAFAELRELCYIFSFKKVNLFLGLQFFPFGTETVIAYECTCT